MSFLLVDLDGCRIARGAERMVVREGSVTLGEYPTHDLECVIAWGRVEVTRAAMEMILSRGVPLRLIGGGGRYQGCVMPVGDGSVRRSRAQFDMEDDGVRRLALAKVATRAELLNLGAVMRRWRIHRG